MEPLRVMRLATTDYERLDRCCTDLDFGRKSSVDGAARCDLQKPRSLGFVEIAFQQEAALDFIQHPSFRLAVLTVRGVNSCMAELHFNAL
jgi:hypothetical protein